MRGPYPIHAAVPSRRTVWQPEPCRKSSRTAGVRRRTRTGSRGEHASAKVGEGNGGFGKDGRPVEERGVVRDGRPDRVRSRNRSFRGRGTALREHQAAPTAG